MGSFGLKYRQGVAMGDAKQNEGLETPKNIVRFDNLAYGAYDDWNLLDVYRPKDAVGNLPVILNVHGGGWVAGGKDSSQFYCMSLAEHGFAVINPSYRLAPEFRWPAGVEDMNQAVCWMMEHRAQYGFDTDNVFLMGDSAGANMAAVYGCICSNSEYAGQYKFQPPEGFCPRALGLNCGIYHVPKNRIGLIGMFMKDLLGPGYRKKDMIAMSPCFYVTENFPPSYIMTSTGDFMKKDPKYLIEKLEQFGIPYEYKVYGTADNKLPHVFHTNIRLPEAGICNEEECRFFQRYIQ